MNQLDEQQVLIDRYNLPSLQIMSPWPYNLPAQGAIVPFPWLFFFFFFLENLLSLKRNTVCSDWKDGWVASGLPHFQCEFLNSDNTWGVS